MALIIIIVYYYSSTTFLGIIGTPSPSREKNEGTHRTMNHSLLETAGDFEACLPAVGKFYTAHE